MKPQANTVLHWDQAATCRPRRPELVGEIQEYLELYTANPGRGLYAGSRAAWKLIGEAREQIAEFVAAPEHARVAFTAGTTDALNLAIQGTLRRGDHAIATAYEHNSVLRPLRYLAEQGFIRLEIWHPAPDGRFRIEDLQALQTPQTRLVCLTHASNVVGAVLPIQTVGRLLSGTDTCLLVDCAQTAGVLPINMAGSRIDLLAFSAHKGLGSAPGIGCLVMSGKAQVRPIRFGGTGGGDVYDIVPRDPLAGLEPGTPNVMGILLLMRAIQRCPPEEVLKRCVQARKLRSLLMREFREIPQTQLLTGVDEGLPILSLKLLTHTPNELAAWLDDTHQIETRAGHHCAPLIHEAFGTRDHGTLRLSPPLQVTEDEVRLVRQAIIQGMEGL